jgi:hypothetical protein
MRIINYKDYHKNTKGISNFKLNGVCEKCSKEYTISSVKSFRRRIYDDIFLCHECYMEHACYKNPSWIEKNSASQKIAQNKPEQKRKNAIAVSKSKRWTKEKRKLESKRMKERWANASEEQKNAMLSGLRWTEDSGERFNEIISKSAKGFCGYYNGMFYNSLLELSFLIECEERNIKVRRYDLEPIQYKEDGKDRKYHPDFIIFDKVVVEIKGHIFKGIQGEKKFELKNKAALSFCSCNNLKYRVFFRSEFLKKNLRKAKTIHIYENKEKEDI